MSTTADTPETAPVAPGDFRSKFSQDVADDYNALRAAVRSAMKATKEVSISCPHCQRSSKHTLPDHRAAIDAARFAVEQGFGKAPSSPKEYELPDLEGVPVREMTDAELNAYYYALTTPEERAQDRAQLEQLLNTVNDPALSGAQKLDRIDTLYPIGV